MLIIAPCGPCQAHSIPRATPAASIVSTVVSSGGAVSENGPGFQRRSEANISLSMHVWPGWGMRWRPLRCTTRAGHGRPAPARVLAAYGCEQITPRWPDDLVAELGTVNDDLAAAVAAFAARWFDNDVTSGCRVRRAVTFAVLDLPGSAIRRYLLASRPPPAGLDAPIHAAARAALDAV